MNSRRKMTPKGEMALSGAGPAISQLPPYIQELFNPPPPLEYRRPIVKRKMPPLGGLADFASEFETTAPPPREIMETPKQRKDRIRKAKMQENDLQLAEEIEKWDPQAKASTENAYNTLFVGRLSYETSESKLRREFEQYGPIRMLKIVEDLEGNSRGYAFIEYEREEDMRAAYKIADGRKIDGRRVVVDVERGRTVKNWRPRKLGGGLGGTRRGGKEQNSRHSGREPPEGSRESYRSRSRDRDRSRDRRDFRRDDRERGHRDRDDRDRRDRYRDRRDGDRYGSSGRFRGSRDYSRDDYGGGKYGQGGDPEPERSSKSSERKDRGSSRDSDRYGGGRYG